MPAYDWETAYDDMRMERDKLEREVTRLEIRVSELEELVLELRRDGKNDDNHYYSCPDC